jgi:phytoene/squalene synthetase
MRLETSFMRKLLLEDAPHVAIAAVSLSDIQRQGVRALYTFFRISRDTVDKAASKVEAQISVQHLNLMFETSNVSDAIEEIPDLGLAWEAWLGLEEEFGIPRVYALEFVRGLRLETENFRPENVEDLLRYCYLTGGILGLIVSFIITAPESAKQMLVDAGSAARLTTLARNIPADFARGRIFVPTEWFSRSATTVIPGAWSKESEKRFNRLAALLYKSSREAFPLLPYRSRIALATALVLHREKGRSVFRRIDRAFDEFIRQSAGAIASAYRNETPPQLPIATRDMALALRNQNLRIASYAARPHEQAIE